MYSVISVAMTNEQSMIVLFKLVSGFLATRDT